MCMAKVHLPPMNKFARKLHGCIVYLILILYMFWPEID